MIQEYKQSSM